MLKNIIFFMTEKGVLTCPHFHHQAHSQLWKHDNNNTVWNIISRQQPKNTICEWNENNMSERTCSYNCRLGFISQWGALAGRYAALCPPGWPWAHHRMPFHSPTHGEYNNYLYIHIMAVSFVYFCMSPGTFDNGIIYTVYRAYSTYIAQLHQCSC